MEEGEMRSSEGSGVEVLVISEGMCTYLFPLHQIIMMI